MCCIFGDDVSLFGIVPQLSFVFHDIDIFQKDHRPLVLGSVSQCQFYDTLSRLYLVLQFQREVMLCLLRTSHLEARDINVDPLVMVLAGFFSVHLLSSPCN